MNIIISGASGFIGRNLTGYLTSLGWNVTALTRNNFKLKDEEFAAKLEGYDLIIHLTGAPIIKRWTKRYRREIYDSRILTTRKISQAILLMHHKPKLFISNAGVAIYRNHRAYCDEETDQFADDFLGRLCQDWESEALKASGVTSVVVLRLGIVLSGSGGALKKMLLPFKLGVGGRISSGFQPFPWIHLHDLLNIYHFLMTNQQLTGPVNVTSPGIINNRQFTRALAKALHRPAILPVPSFLLYVIYGQGAETLTMGQSAYPKKLLEAGFEFNFPEIEGALVDLVGKR